MGIERHISGFEFGTPAKKDCPALFGEIEQSLIDFHQPEEVGVVVSSFAELALVDVRLPMEIGNTFSRSVPVVGDGVDGLALQGKRDVRLVAHVLSLAARRA